MTTNPPAGQTIKWWVAVLLSSFFPGIGQIYSGEIKKGYVMAGLGIAAHLLRSSYFGLSYDSILVLVVLGLILFVWSPLDSLIQVKFRKIAKWRSTWGPLALLFGISYVLAGGLEHATTPLGTMTISSDAMAPTILKGDQLSYFMAAKNQNLLSRGTLVIVELPLDRTVLIAERVVGQPGDSVEYKDKKLIVNDVPCEYRPVEIGSGERKKIEMPDLPFPVEAIIETCPGETPRTIFQSSKFEMDVPRVVLKPAEYFVLGDNRAASHDSRAIGPVPEARIVGVPKLVFLSFRESDLQFRWDRSGKRL